MIPITDCIEGGFYRICSRNLPFGVFVDMTKRPNGQGVGFIGIRHKFGERFLDFELHWDDGTGTAQPREYICQCPISTDWKNKGIDKALFDWIDQTQGVGSFQARGVEVEGHKIQAAKEHIPGKVDFEKRQVGKPAKWLKDGIPVEEWLLGYQSKIYFKSENTLWTIVQGDDDYFYISLWTWNGQEGRWENYVAVPSYQEAKEFCEVRNAKETFCDGEGA